MECRTASEFGDLGECQIKLEYWHQPEEEDTNTAEDITVESGSFLYNGTWIEMSRETSYLPEFEQCCWDHHNSIMGEVQ